MSLPTIEQVREHQKRGGLWLLRFTERIPAYRCLSLSNLPGEITGLWNNDNTAVDFIPCDQQGNPLNSPMVWKARLQLQSPEEIALWSAVYATIMGTETQPVSGRVIVACEEADNAVEELRFRLRAPSCTPEPRG